MTVPFDAKFSFYLSGDTPPSVDDIFDRIMRAFPDYEIHDAHGEHSAYAPGWDR